MNGAPVPVLWLCGPPGVGKTTVGWELFTRLAADGPRAGYVDIDQLGICYPEPATDPGRHRMKARNLAAVLATFRDAGACAVVVSGVVDPQNGPPLADGPTGGITVVRLRAEPAELRRRLAGRARPVDEAAAALREADLLDSAGFADACVDTTGRTVADVVAAVRGYLGGGGRGLAPEGAPPAGLPDGAVVWLTGAPGVGTSTVGWQVYERILGAGRTAAYVDLAQLGFLRPGEPDPDHAVRARNLAALWATYRAAGALTLVAVGPVGDPGQERGYTDLLPAATVTVCRLHAGPEALRERIGLRGRGIGPPVPGDELAGQPAEVLAAAADAAATEAAAMDRAGVGDLRVDMDGRGVEEIAAEVLDRTVGR